MDIAASTGVVASHADLLPRHAHDAVRTHSAADPVITGAILWAARRVSHRCCRSAGWGEPLRGCGHVQRLMRAGRIVVVHPLIKCLLGCLEIGERWLVAEAL